MFKISEDVELVLKEKYPNVNVRQFIHDLFQALLDKTLRDGSVAVREFGKFLAFSTYSKRVGKELVRFKFKPTFALTNKLKNDPYLLETLPVKTPAQFTEKHEELCKDKKEQRQLNFDAMQKAQQLGRKRTQEKLARDEIERIISDD